MAKWKTVRRPSGASVLEQRTPKCRLLVYLRNWANPRGPASWIASCGGNEMPERALDFDAPDYHERRGHAETLNAAKAAAKRAADAHMLKTRKRRPDADAIEAIAKDAEREARGLRTFDPAKAKALRAKARETRKQMFEGARKRR
jgi:hypothetical protein